MQIESVSNHMTKSEREVAELFQELDIPWTYEQPIFVWDENKRPRVWAPDFYLKPFDIYVEVCGSETFDYEYRRSIYNINGYKVVFLHLYKETNRWKEYLMNYLQRVTENRNVKLREIMNKII